MNLKRTGRLSILSFLATFCPVFAGVLVLFFGYTLPFYVLGLPLLITGAVSIILRTYILIRYGKEFAKIPKAIIDAVMLSALIVLSMVFTTAKIVDTETGLKIIQSGTVSGTIGFVFMYIGTLAVLSPTNRKIGKAYFQKRKAEKEKSDSR